MDLAGATLRIPEKSVKESCAKARYWLSVGSTECVRLQFQPTSEWASQERYKRGPGIDWIQARTLLCLKDGAVPPAAIGSPRTGSPAGPSSSSVTATAAERCCLTAGAASTTRLMSTTSSLTTTTRTQTSNPYAARITRPSQAPRVAEPLPRPARRSTATRSVGPQKSTGPQEGPPNR